MKTIKLLFFFLIFLLSCQSTKIDEQPKSITIHAIGDSTMANKPKPEENPERGWVQVLGQFFNDQVTIHNHAVNGRSTKSFRELGHWQPVLDQLKSGDYLLIQFGHNDAKETDPTRYTNPQTAYRYNLIKYIEEAKSKGATPILLSSIARRKFNKEGVLIDSHGNYTLMARLVAQDMNVSFIDMQFLTEQLELKYGVEDSKKLHLHFTPNEHSFIPDGIEDNTHLSVLGATEISKIFVEEIKKQNHPLNKYLRKIFNTNL